MAQGFPSRVPQCIGASSPLSSQNTEISNRRYKIDHEWGQRPQSIKRPGFGNPGRADKISPYHYTLLIFRNYSGIVIFPPRKLEDTKVHKDFLCSLVALRPGG